MGTRVGGRRVAKWRETPNDGEGVEPPSGSGPPPQRQLVVRVSMHRGRDRHPEYLVAFAALAVLMLVRRRRATRRWQRENRILPQPAGFTSTQAFGDDTRPLSVPVPPRYTRGQGSAGAPVPARTDTQAFRHSPGDVGVGEQSVRRSQRAVTRRPTQSAEATAEPRSGPRHRRRLRTRVGRPRDGRSPGRFQPWNW